MSSLRGSVPCCKTVKGQSLKCPYSHSAGYYKAGDLFKAGLLPTWITALLWALCAPTWFGLFGF